MTNIVLFSDGTGNSSAKLQKTNVWRLFQALDQKTAAQFARYDNGVGTSSNKYLAALGGAFGWGLKRNVLDLYKFVCQNHKAGDQIYGFGFSRGSFTIRVLVDFVATEGLVTSRSDEELTRNAAAAYRHYRAAKFPSRSPIVMVMRCLRDVLLWAKDRVKGYRSYKEIKQKTEKEGRANIPIRFIGLWDTVDAYGMPIAGLKRGIDLVLWPMLFGDRILSPRVERACHALSLDDERTTFHPILWDEVKEAEMIANGEVQAGRLTQVWFAGVHSNVGGGYPEDQLSLVSLEWMMARAIENGLVLEPQAVAQVSAAKSAYARMYDSRAGFGAYYHYGPRELPVCKDAHGTPILPIIDGSVVLRMAYGSDHYSPISLPHQFWVLAPDGGLIAMEGAPLSIRLDQTKAPAASDASAMERGTDIVSEKDKLRVAIRKLARPDRDSVRLVWDTVFWRRCTYLVIAGMTFLLIVYPWLGDWPSRAAIGLLTSIPVIGGDVGGEVHDWSVRFDNGSRGPISTIVDALSGLLPGYAQRSMDGLKAHPLEMGLIMLTVLASLMGSNILKGRIHDRSRLAWHRELRQDYAAWIEESQKGWRNGVMSALGVTVILWVLSLTFKPSATILHLELGVLAGMFAIVLAARTLGRRPTTAATGPVRSTFALSVARWLRDNRFLRKLWSFTFDRFVPIVFALLLVVAGWFIANRVLYEVFNAAGHFCKGSVIGEARKKEKIGLSSGTFHTDAMCWPSGLVLEEGRRYRITVTTPGDWFDRTIPTDVAGFPVDNFKHLAATPLKRAWTENWFKPIARINEIGNDEYVLAPADGFGSYPYPDCGKLAHDSGPRGKITEAAAEERPKCAPTPEDRKAVSMDITARTTGELLLYVNDAVLMWPGSTELFVSNNTGTATVKVERAAPR